MLESSAGVPKKVWSHSRVSFNKLVKEVQYFNLFHFYMMAQHTHLVSSKSNRNTVVDTVKKNVHSHGELDVVSAAAHSLG